MVPDTTHIDHVFVSLPPLVSTFSILVVAKIALMSSIITRLLPDNCISQCVY